MLILSRFVDESIIISTPLGRVEVIVMDVGCDGKVRLGFVAPGVIEVHRKEIQLRIDKEKEKEKGATNGIESNLSS